MGEPCGQVQTALPIVAVAVLRAVQPKRKCDDASGSNRRADTTSRSVSISKVTISRPRTIGITGRRPVDFAFGHAHVTITLSAKR
jgi:hypothetical protein